MPRQLISDDGVVRRYRVLDGQGNQIGLDEEPIPTTVDINATTLRDRATQALAGNNNYLGIASPTNAQVVTQVARLTRESSGVIRLLLGLVDDTTGT